MQKETTFKNKKKSVERGVNKKTREIEIVNLTFSREEKL